MHTHTQYILDEKIIVCLTLDLLALATMKYKLLPVTCGNTEKQGLNYGNGALMNLPRIWSSENSIIILMNAPAFWIVTQKVLSYAIYSSTTVFLSRSGIRPLSKII